MCAWMETENESPANIGARTILATMPAPLSGGAACAGACCSTTAPALVVMIVTPA